MFSNNICPETKSKNKNIFEDLQKKKERKKINFNYQEIIKSYHRRMRLNEE